MEQVSIIKRKIYDPLQRVLHWTIALSCLILLATGLGAELIEAGKVRNQLWHLHINAGYLLTVALFLRIIWAFIGPRFASLKDFFKFFTKKKVEDLQKFTEFGHDPKAALAYLLLYASFIMIILTGLVLAGIEHNLGPFADLTFDRLYLREYFKEPHEIFSYFVILFTVTHIGALLYHQRQHKLPMWYAMIDGIQYRFKKINCSHKTQKQSEVKNA
jgi:cytochrome b561